MSNIRTSLPIPTQPWDAAKAKFLDGLSPQEIQRFKDATLENLFYDASSVQKRHAHDSRVWLLQERLSSLTDAIEDYGKALDVYANTYGPVMSPLWGSLRVVLHIVSEAGRFQESVVEMLAQIGDVLPRFRIYETLFKNHERLLVALSTAFLDILQFCVITKDFFARAKRSMIPLSIVLKGAWKSYRRDFETCMIGFRTHTKRVEKEAGLAHMIESARSREIELANRALHIRNGKLQRRHRVLATLPSVDYSTKHLKLSNLRHPGTNNWLCTTPQYLSWFAKATSDCLCCYGIPGSGKSVLSASLVDHIQDVTANDTKSIICYYYCDYLDNASLEPYRLLASIIKQILERLPLDHFDDTFKSPFQEGQTAPTLSRSLAYFLKLLQYFRTVYLVIDGIDELAPNDQVTVLDSIGSILRHPFVIARVYVASRLEEDLIRRTLKPYPTLRLTKDCVRGDIALVIDEQIRSTVTRQNPLLADENLRQEVVNALVSRADDMFLWVKFQLYDIGQALTEDAVRTVIRNLPKDISETYARIIEKVYHAPGGETTFVTMKSIFQWVAGARRPLQVEELEEAVGLENTDTHLHTERLATNAGGRLISCCGNLVVFHEEDSTVTFAHHTVKQFLYAPSRAHGFTFPDIQFSSQSADNRIGEICLAYLSFADFETQIARTPDIIKLEQEDAEHIIWANVALATPVRTLVSWSRGWRGTHSSKSDTRLKLAVPVFTAPSETLSRKYAMLDYITTFWAIHTMYLTPESSCWARFKQIALYRQLAFEFRPWNESDHQKRVEIALHNLRQDWEKRQPRSLKSPNIEKAKPRKSTVELTPLSKDLLVFSWALRHGVGSLLNLISYQHMIDYFREVGLSTGQVTFPFKTLKSNLYQEEFQRFVTATANIDPSADRTLGSTSISSWSDPCSHGFLDGKSINRLVRVDPNAQGLLDFVKMEFLRWVDTGGMLWDNILREAMILAIQSAEIYSFKVLVDYHVRTYRQFVAILVIILQEDLVNKSILKFLLSRKIDEDCSAADEWQLLFALHHCFPLVNVVLGSQLKLSQMSTLVQQACLVLLLAVSKRPNPLQRFVGLDFDSIPRRSIPSESDRDYFLPNADWTCAAFGTADVVNQLQRVVGTDIYQGARKVTQLAHNFQALDSLDLLDDIGLSELSSKITFFITKLGDLFDVTAFELDGIHCLQWAMEKDVVEVTEALVPAYRELVCDRRWKHCVLGIIAAGRNSRYGRTALTELVPDSVLRSIVDEFEQRDSPSIYFSLVDKDAWLRRIRMAPETRSLGDLDAKWQMQPPLEEGDWDTIQDMAFELWKEMVHAWRNVVGQGRFISVKRNG